MNVMNMMALAMNPNVTAEFLEEQMRKDAEHKQKMLDDLLAACEKDPENAWDLMNQCMPMILNF